MQFYVPLSVNDIGDRHWSLKITAETVKKVLELDNNLGDRHGRQKGPWSLTINLVGQWSATKTLVSGEFVGFHSMTSVELKGPCLSPGLQRLRGLQQALSDSGQCLRIIRHPELRSDLIVLQEIDLRLLLLLCNIAWVHPAGRPGYGEGSGEGEGGHALHPLHLHALPLLNTSGFLDQPTYIQVPCHCIQVKM